MINFSGNELEVYEFRPRTNVVPGHIISKCLKHGSSKLKFMPPPLFKKHFYSAECSLINEEELILTIKALDELYTYRLYAKNLLNEKKVEEDTFYAISREAGLRPIEIRDPREGYFKLYYGEWIDWPTLFINGIHMHRITGGGPLADTIIKVNTARIQRHMKVLDTCMGLGYTALLSALKGAKVYTIEVSENVLAIAEHNPPSWLLTRLNVTILHADVTEAIHYMPDNFFDRVIHDPPRFEIAGELYSLEFYKELYRVLRRNGILFHYTGMPRKLRGRGHGPIVRGIISRLREAGFYIKRYDEKAQGVVAVKY
jgi:predicted methyltransferase